MDVIPGYKILETLHHGNSSIIYRAQRQEDNKVVIIKMLGLEYPSPRHLALFRREYDFTSSINLIEVPGVFEINNYKNTLFFVLEDFGSSSLSSSIQAVSADLKFFLKISLSIAEALGKLHSQKIIHKDLNPSNILLNPKNGFISIIDFGISTKLSKKKQALVSVEKLEGTLGYISPEQTGRMNRVVDYRTDLYSLGVIFYELSTGKLPFETDDPMEMVHSHIAKIPLAPARVNKDVPEVLSDIIMKLMAKTPENRYQSIKGLVHDLDYTLDALEKGKPATRFETGTRDVSPVFQIPQKLYGREKDIRKLISSFENVCTGEAIFLFITGEPGIGKTSLVNELHKQLIKTNSYFISGKSDQYKRDIPYFAIIEAFQGLANQILSESHLVIENWKTRITDALGANCKIIIDIIPEMESILGGQAELPLLSPPESENRFKLTLLNFFNTVAAKDHPVILFLDDLQWIDSASLELLKLLGKSLSLNFLLIIGSYRDNEVDDVHPLSMALTEIEKYSGELKRLKISSLKQVDIVNMVSDSMGCSKEKSKDLAALSLKKTGGNPFFLTQFLQSLYQKEMIFFNEFSGKWKWNINNILAMNFSENIITMLVEKLKLLPEKTREVVKKGACIGNEFDLTTISRVMGIPSLEVYEILTTAVDENFITPLTETDSLVEPESFIINPRYQFVHDRVQQASYSLLNDQEKERLHLKVGRVIEELGVEKKTDKNLFTLVNHINFSLALITDPDERKKYAKFNLIAGKKARLATAYSQSFKYLSAAIKLLDDRYWDSDYELMLEIYTSAAQSSYLNNDFSSMENILATVMEKAKNILDKVRLYEIKISAHTAKNELDKAIDTAIDVLKFFDIKIPLNPGKIGTIPLLVKMTRLVSGKTIDYFLALPEMKDPQKLAVVRILSSMNAPAYVARPSLNPFLVYHLILFSKNYGNSMFSPLAYYGHGFGLTVVLGKIDEGYKFAEMALKLMEQRHEKIFKCRIQFLFYTFHKPRKFHAKETFAPLKEAYYTGLETGDFEYASYSILTYFTFVLWSGKSLDLLFEEMEKYTPSLRQLNQKLIINWFFLFKQVVHNIMTSGTQRDQVSGQFFNEEEMIVNFNKSGDLSGLCFLYIFKVSLCYLFGFYKKAMENVQKIPAVLSSQLGTPSVTAFHFYDSLTVLALFENLTRLQKIKAIKRVKKIKKSYKNGQTVLQ
jgi:predicted ATPase